jgi:predicted HAD superfamily phosphohydrolase
MTANPAEVAKIRELKPLRNAYLDAIDNSVTLKIQQMNTRDDYEERKLIENAEEAKDEIRRIWGRAVNSIAFSTYPRNVFKFLNPEKGAEKARGFDLDMVAEDAEYDMRRIAEAVGVVFEKEEIYETKQPKKQWW